MLRILILMPVIVACGCREQEPGPAVNRNLGTSQAPLLPPKSSLPDPDILTGPRMPPIELPEFNQDMPTLAEMESRAADRAAESAGAGEQTSAAAPSVESQESDPDDADNSEPDGQ
jgi:hypothetical protein